MSFAPPEIRPGPAASVRPLRQVVLRPGQPAGACVYPGDDDPDTVHFSAILNGDVVGIASLYHEASPVLPDADAWRLRGMATADAVRGAGLGGRLLEACIEHAQRRGGTLLWCNARATAAGFYRRYGFEQVGDSFDLPHIGPHYYMHLRLGAANAGGRARNS